LENMKDNEFHMDAKEFMRIMDSAMQEAYQKEKKYIMENGSGVEEFESLEIDVKKGIYRLNGKKLNRCRSMTITIKPETAKVRTVIEHDTICETLPIKR